MVALVQELVAWGMPADEAQREAERQLAGRPGEARTDFTIWPENSVSCDVFLACCTQWRTGPMGGCLGLDYPALECVMRMMQVEDIPKVFRDVRIMEAAALEVMNGRN
ncbi:MAG: DUF1799 domain-containing protein [Pseudomonadota bacterium]